MKLSNYFNISRFSLLMKMELFRNFKGIMMTLVILFGLLFIVGFVLPLFIAPNLLTYNHGISYAIGLIAGGLILSSLAFGDLSHTLKRYRYLTLPVSAFEKLLCMWLLTSLGWILLFTLTYFTYSTLANATGSMLFRKVVFQSFNPIGVSSVAVIKYYFVLQGIFMAGAATFKGYVFPKTLFSLVLFAMVCGLITYLIMADMVTADGDYFAGDTITTMPVYRLWQLVVLLFWWVLAPLSWVITYMGIKEKEV